MKDCFNKKPIKTMSDFKGIKIRTMQNQYHMAAFQSFGAMVKTSLCIFQKLPEGATLDKEKEALLVEIENVGYDATGRSKNGSEVNAVAELFHKEVKWS